LFKYCAKEFRYSEAGAYRRIRAARAIKKKPYLMALRAGLDRLENESAD